MNKELQSFLRIEKSSKRYKGRKDDLDAVFTAIRNCETERSLRINLEKINYGLVREKEENQNKLKALEIIKDWLNLKVVELLPNNSDTRLFVECGDFKASISIPPAYIDLLKKVLL